MKSNSFLQCRILVILAVGASFFGSCEEGKEEVRLTRSMEISHKLLAADCEVSALDNTKNRVNLSSILTVSDSGQIYNIVNSSPGMIEGSREYIDMISYALEVVKVDFTGFSETPDAENASPLFTLNIRFPESECSTPNFFLFEPNNNVLVTFEEGSISIELLDESLAIRPSYEGNQLLEYEVIAQALKDAFEENIITIAVSDFPHQVKYSHPDLGISYDRLSFEGKSSQTRAAHLRIDISTLSI